MTELTEGECWRRLALRGEGRLALVTDEGVDIFPVNHLVHDHAIYLRSGPGSKMFQIGRHGEAAFEVDGRGGGRAWSVVVRGRAERLDDDADIAVSGVRELWTRHPGPKFNYVRIVPRSVSGRSFPTFTGSAPLIALAVALGALAVGLGALSIWLGR